MRILRHHPLVRKLSFQQLLNQRIADLELRPNDTLRACLIQLRRELKSKHIAYFPHFYFGDEPWGCIDRTGSVEIPFYLANRSLHSIAKRYYISYSKEEMMMLLRHETGHAINYVYKLWRRDDWKRTFGNFRKQYRNFYSYDPYSKQHVRHLHYIGNPHYAQKHPDEDFAETLAVWLDPDSKWKWNYRKWSGALSKLRYVDHLFRRERVAARRPLKIRYDESGSYQSIDETIAEYFDIKRKIDPKVKEYTQDLKEIFTGVGPRTRRFIRAELFIQNYGEYLEEELATWLAGVDKRDVQTYLRELQTICALNNFRLLPDQATEKLVELVIVSTYHMLQRMRRIL